MQSKSMSYAEIHTNASPDKDVLLFWHSHIHIDRNRTEHFSSKQIYAPEPGWLVGTVFPVDTLDQVHVFFAELKVENFEILFQSIKFGCFWDDNSVTLHTPPENNLSNSLLVFLGQSLTRKA